MGFEVFDKRNAPLAKAPSVTIQKKGIFSINRAAHNLVARPKRWNSSSTGRSRSSR